MSHTRTVIEPAAGLTVIVGPNNCGKSAVVVALQTLCYGQKGDWFVRHGARTARVEVVTGEGDRIEWTRDRDAVTYSINGVRTDRSRAPDDLPSKLRINEVVGDDGKSEFDIHFAEQKKPIFLLGEDRQAALFFASSSDAGYLLQMQQNWRARIRERKAESKVVGEELSLARAKLEGYAPIATLEDPMRLLEESYAELDRLERDRADLRSRLTKARDCQRRLSHHESARLVLASLPPVPVLADAESCRQVVMRWHRAAREAEKNLALIGALRLPETPVLHEVEDLASRVVNLRRRKVYIAKLDRKREVAAKLTEPPTLADTQDLVKTIERFRRAAATVAHSVAALESAKVALASSRESIERYLKEHPTCPTCGGPVDAERFLNREEHTHA